MSSVGNPNPWAPYDNDRDCSQGICSIYCPQFCYLIFPPPPPTHDDSAPFSPLIIAVIGVLASAFLLVSYYTIVTRYCKRRRNAGVESAEDRHESSQDQWQVVQSGLDQAVIEKITVCKYVRGEGLIEGTDCAVCLSEFEENESLRLLPKCSHAFHLPCIDTWLRSQSNCPLCRANVVAIANPYEFQRPEDLVLVVDDPESNCDEHTLVINDDDVPESDHNRTDEERVEFEQHTYSSQRLLLISDILKFDELDEYTDRIWRGDGGSLRSAVAMKKSISTDGSCSK